MWFFVHRLRGGWLSWLSWRNFPAEDFVRSDRRRASLWQSLNKPMNVCDKIVQRPRFRGFISYVLLFFGFNIGKNKLGWYGHKVSWFQAWSSSQAKGSYIMGLGDFNTCWLSDESLQGWQNARWWHVRYHSRIWISCDLHPRRRKLESSGGNTFLSNPGTVSSKKLQKKWVCLTKKKTKYDQIEDGRRKR